MYRFSPSPPLLPSVRNHFSLVGGASLECFFCSPPGSDLNTLLTGFLTTKMAFKFKGSDQYDL